LPRATTGQRIIVLADGKSEIWVWNRTGPATGLARSSTTTSALPPFGPIWYVAGIARAALFDDSETVKQITLYDLAPRASPGARWASRVGQVPKQRRAVKRHRFWDPRARALAGTFTRHLQSPFCPPLRPPYCKTLRTELEPRSGENTEWEACALSTKCAGRFLLR